jgi:Type IV secretion-system coupling protein DNA-binding domain
MPFASGSLWRMSRPLKLKVTGVEQYRLSNSPTTGSRVSLRGRTADVPSQEPVRGVHFDSSCNQGVSSCVPEAVLWLACMSIPGYRSRPIGKRVSTMNELRQLVFERTEASQHFLPAACTLSVSCYQPFEMQDLIASTVQALFQSLACSGLDLSALDGITMAEDCGKAANALRALPAGAIAREGSQQPETFEMGCTVPVWRDRALRFHIVVRAGIGLGLLATDEAVQSVACACFAHEAAHVEHEGHLYQTLSGCFRKRGRPMEHGRQPATSIWLTTKEPKAGQWVSEFIGKVEIERLRETHFDGTRAGRNFALDRQVEPLVLESEISGLADLHAYMKYQNYVTRFAFPYFNMPVVAEGFELRERLDDKLPYTAKPTEEAEPAATELKQEPEASASPATDEIAAVEQIEPSLPSCLTPTTAKT